MEQNEDALNTNAGMTARTNTHPNVWFEVDPLRLCHYEWTTERIFSYERHKKAFTLKE